jgi:hypothetical protein
MPEKISNWMAEDMLKRLSEHYGQRVAPVSKYCEALESWAEVVNSKDYTRVDESAIDVLRLAIYKSNLLYRMVYLGEPLRTIKCPTHDGHWSGMHFSDKPPCECTDRAGNITGWLPTEQSQVYNPVWVSLETGHPEMKPTKRSKVKSDLPRATSILVHRDPEKK